MKEFVYYKEDTNEIAVFDQDTIELHLLLLYRAMRDGVLIFLGEL
jgi:hypothetical protein